MAGKKTERFQVLVDRELMEKLQVLKREEERSLSQIAERLIRLGIETKERMEAEEGLR